MENNIVKYLVPWMLKSPLTSVLNVLSQVQFCANSQRLSMFIELCCQPSIVHTRVDEYQQVCKCKMSKQTQMIHFHIFPLLGKCFVLDFPMNDGAG